MRFKIVLTLLLFLLYSNCFSQYFVGYENNLGTLFEELPHGSRVVDTVIEYRPNYQQSWARLDSVSQYSSKDSIKQGESNVNSTYFTHMIPLRVHCTGGIDSTSQLVLDTNGILFDTLNFNQFMNSYAETFFFISNNSTISSRIINPTAGRYYDVHFNLEYDSLVKLLVTSDLPSMDTIFVDSSGARYTQIPVGFAAIDTNTFKIDSMIQNMICTASNSSSGSCRFRYVKPYNQYYLAFTIFNRGINSGRFGIDLDTINLYSGMYAGQGGPPFGQNHYLNDTVIMDSNSTLTLTVYRGKNDVVGFKNELFRTETRIFISNIVGLDDELVSSVKVKLYPNPSKDKVFVKGKDVSNEFYQIFTIAGKLASEGMMKGNEIPIHTLTKGIYFISIPELGVRQKIIKN